MSSSHICLVPIGRIEVDAKVETKNTEKPLEMSIAKLIAFSLLLVSSSSKAWGGAQAMAMTYSNLAVRALLTRAQDASQALTAAGFLPPESFARATIQLQGQSTHPSAEIRAQRCWYDFRDGYLTDIRRREICEAVGADNPFLRHMTNHVLSLFLSDAPRRAFEVLQRLSYPSDRLRNIGQVQVDDDLLSISPVRDSISQYPIDLKFFGEILSREKIDIKVNLSWPGEKATSGFKRKPPDTRIEFLATTGELLEAMFLPDKETLSEHGVIGPDQITIAEASDFSPPVFVSAIRRLTDAEAVLQKGDSAGVIREAWDELESKLGSNRPKCVLVCENLNDPAAVAAEMKVLVGETPWAGVSHFFRFDLPFDRAQMERTALGKRGVSLFAICGDVDTQFEILSGLENEPALEWDESLTPEGLEKEQTICDNTAHRLAPSLEDLIRRLHLSNSAPDQILFPIQGGYVYPASIMIQDELQMRLRGKKVGVFANWGATDTPHLSGNITYFNGNFYTNAVVVLRLSGYLPLQPDLLWQMKVHAASYSNSPNFDPQQLNGLKAAGPSRITGNEIWRPIRDAITAFKPSSLENLIALFGADQIRFLRQCDKLEVVEINSDRVGASNTATIEGFKVVTPGSALGAEAARDLVATLLDESNIVWHSSGFDWRPAVVFRLWHEKECATLVVSFYSPKAYISFYDSSGHLTRRSRPFVFRDRETFAGLARQALPGSHW
jgi:hypothetical protein